MMDGGARLVWKPRTWRVVLGFLVAPLAAAAIFAFYAIVLGYPEYTVLLAMYSVLIPGYPSALVLGVPMYLVLRRWLWNWWVATGAGAVGAIVVLALNVAVELAQHGTLSTFGNFTDVGVLGLSVGAGATGGLSFWIVAALGEKREPPTESIFV